MGHSTGEPVAAPSEKNLFCSAAMRSHMRNIELWMRPMPVRCDSYSVANPSIYQRGRIWLGSSCLPMNRLISGASPLVVSR